MAARTGPTCGADRRNNMGPCGPPAGWHTDHPGVGRCSWHGGNAPNGVKAAAREIVDEQARRVLARMDAPPCTNPFAALRRLAGEAEAWRATCAYLLNKLGADELRYSGQVGGLKAEQVRAEVTMYSNAISQSASILTGLAKLDIETAWQARSWMLTRCHCCGYRPPAAGNTSKFGRHWTTPKFTGLAYQPSELLTGPSWPSRRLRSARIVRDADTADYR